MELGDRLGRYTPTRLVLQNDGNLVLYHVSDQAALWSTKTAGH